MMHTTLAFVGRLACLLALVAILLTCGVVYFSTTQQWQEQAPTVAPCGHAVYVEIRGMLTSVDESC